MDRDPGFDVFLAKVLNGGAWLNMSDEEREIWRQIRDADDD
jgi:hypothetical protein